MGFWGGVEGFLVFERLVGCLLVGCRYQASRDDLAVFVALESVPEEYVNVNRWFKHISALAGPQYVPSSCWGCDWFVCFDFDVRFALSVLSDGVWFSFLRLLLVYCSK